MDNFKKPHLKRRVGVSHKLVKHSEKLKSTSNVRHAPGWVYILVAQGYHGIFPGCFIKRCKIGLTHDVPSRLKRLESSQAPCDYKLIKSIYVRDMADVESLLHEQFLDCNVQLKQSREWFDLPLWRLWSAYLAFSHYEQHHRYGVRKLQIIPLGIIAFCLLGFTTVAFIIQQSSRQLPRPPEPIDLKELEVGRRISLRRIGPAALFAGAGKTGQTIDSYYLNFSYACLSSLLAPPAKVQSLWQS